MTRKRLRCAIYTRKSTDEGLDQDYNSLVAQRDACLAYIKSQTGEGWVATKDLYDDGGYSGGSMERPALQQLLTDIRNKTVDVVVVYKVDRLTRSLADFAKIVETLDDQGVSFVSVTQQFNTTSSMGRLTLNVLLSFAQFEREVTAERIRDKIAASKKKGMWMGGVVPLGYNVVERKLIVNASEAETVHTLFRLYRELGTVKRLKEEADRLGLRTKARKPNNSCHSGRRGGDPFTMGHLYKLLANRLYLGEMTHKGASYPGEHDAIIEPDLWDAVEDQLSRNALKRSRTAKTNGSNLLTGLLYDEEGNRISPHYCLKQGRRYRYYVSRNPEARSEWRLPARTIETVVISGLVAFLKDQRQLIDQVIPAQGPNDAVERVLARARELGNRLETGTASQRRSILVDLVDRTDLSQVRVRVEMRRSELLRRLREENGNPRTNDTDDTSVVIDLPVTFKRRGVETKIVIAGEENAVSTPDPALINAVTSAHRWFADLKTGKAQSIKHLAESVGVDKGDVSRILPLAFLAPDIVEAILDGRHPIDLTAYRLKRIHTLPYDWQAQRVLLGFT